MLDSTEWQQLRLRRVTVERLAAFAERIALAYGRRAAGKLFVRSFPSHDEALAALLDRADGQLKRQRRYRKRKKGTAALVMQQSDR